MKNLIKVLATGFAFAFATGVAGQALAKTCELAIESNDAMQYNKKVLPVIGWVTAEIPVYSRA